MGEIGESKLSVGIGPIFHPQHLQPHPGKGSVIPRHHCPRSEVVSPGGGTVIVDGLRILEAPVGDAQEERMGADQGAGVGRKVRRPVVAFKSIPLGKGKGEAKK